MNGKITEFEYEQQVRSIETASLINAWYETGEDATPPGAGDLEFHSVTRALYLQTADHRYFRITWADELNIYHGFGVSLKQVSLYPDRNPQLLHLSNHPAWRPFFNTPILSTRIHWQYVLDNMRGRLLPFCGMGYLRRTDYPQSVELLFEPGCSLFFSALSIDEAGNSATMANHLTIFFSKTKHDLYNQPLRQW